MFSFRLLVFRRATAFSRANRAPEKPLDPVQETRRAQRATGISVYPQALHRRVILALRQPVGRVPADLDTLDHARQQRVCASSATGRRAARLIVLGQLHQPCRHGILFHVRNSRPEMPFLQRA